LLTQSYLNKKESASKNTTANTSITTQRKSNLDKSFSSTNKSILGPQNKVINKQALSRNLTPGKKVPEKSVTKRDSIKQLTKQKTLTNLNNRTLKTQKSNTNIRNVSKDRGASEDTLKKSKYRLIPRSFKE
jgi:hypothetical protein